MAEPSEGEELRIRRWMDWPSVVALYCGRLDLAVVAISGVPHRIVEYRVYTTVEWHVHPNSSGHPGWSLVGGAQVRQ
jgi:hypothetical protein